MAEASQLQPRHRNKECGSLFVKAVRVSVCSEHTLVSPSRCYFIYELFDANFVLQSVGDNIFTETGMRFQGVSIASNAHTNDCNCAIPFC